jgi:hypothetical protein
VSTSTSGTWALLPQIEKQRVFVSYHHRGDQVWFERFAAAFTGQYQIVADDSIERAVEFEDTEAVIRRIRDRFVADTRCTVVLVGVHTSGRKFVDWEVDATLATEHGLIALLLPTVTHADSALPERLADNISSGYAMVERWDTLLANPVLLGAWIDTASERQASLIRNDRPRRTTNA